MIVFWDGPYLSEEVGTGEPLISDSAWWLTVAKHPKMRARMDGVPPWEPDADDGQQVAIWAAVCAEAERAWEYNKYHYKETR